MCFKNCNYLNQLVCKLIYDLLFNTCTVTTELTFCTCVGIHGPHNIVVYTCRRRLSVLSRYLFLCINLFIDSMLELLLLVTISILICSLWIICFGFVWSLCHLHKVNLPVCIIPYTFCPPSCILRGWNRGHGKVIVFLIN